jgi:hypothetical protein
MHESLLRLKIFFLEPLIKERLFFGLTQCAMAITPFLRNATKLFHSSSLYCVEILRLANLKTTLTGFEEIKKWTNSSLSGLVARGIYLCLA